MDPKNLCGILATDDEGSFHARAIKPTKYKVPEDGPGCSMSTLAYTSPLQPHRHRPMQLDIELTPSNAGGELMAYMGRHSWRPAHVHFIISADGYQKAPHGVG